MGISITSRLILRELTPDDQDELAKVLSEVEAMRYYPHPFSDAEVAGWIRWNMDNYHKYGHGLWGVIRREDGVFLGDCGITMQEIEGRELPELGYHIIPAYGGRGYATEAAAACVTYAFETLGIDVLYSYTTPANIPSRRVAEKIGMKEAGRFQKEIEGQIYEEVLHFLEKKEGQGK
jgi:RimJ/RimL family protein N-acetyltransferase